MAYFFISASNHLGERRVLRASHLGPQCFCFFINILFLNIFRITPGIPGIPNVTESIISNVHI